jgi:hypothetical protein
VERLHIVPGRAARPLGREEPIPDEGYAWLIFTYEEADQVAAEVQRFTGARIYDDHIDDAKNLAHPSSFDSTEEYELVIFRGLKPDRKPERIEPRPLALFNFERLLVTIGPADSRSVAQPSELGALLEETVPDRAAGRVGSAALLRRDLHPHERGDPAPHPDHFDLHAAQPDHRDLRHELRLHSGAALARRLLDLARVMLALVVFLVSFFRWRHWL